MSAPIEMRCPDCVDTGEHPHAYPGYLARNVSTAGGGATAALVECPRCHGTGVVALRIGDVVRYTGEWLHLSRQGGCVTIGHGDVGTVVDMRADKDAAQVQFSGGAVWITSSCLVPWTETPEATP